MVIDSMGHMTIIKQILLSAAVLFMAPAVGIAAESAVTPYGDHCRECTVYGSGDKPIPPHAAVHALEKYFEERGYTLGEVRHKGRFIEADILKGGRQVDRVLFDRKTGRVRSVY